MAKKSKKLVLIRYVPKPRRHRRELKASDLMGECTHQTSFRPQTDVMEDYVGIKEWCEDNHSSFSSLINSFLPAIRYTILNKVFIDPDSRRRYMRADFGDVILREPRQKE